MRTRTVLVLLRSNAAMSLGFTWFVRLFVCLFVCLFLLLSDFFVRFLLLKSCLSWTGHMISMGDHCIPKQLLFGELEEGHRNRAVPAYVVRTQSKKA